MILSDKAKKFAIATEIHEGSSSEMLKIFLYSFSASYLVGALTFRAKQRFPMVSKYLFLSFFGSFFGAFFVLIKDRVRCNVEKATDEYLATLGLDYLEGGYEFYEKLLDYNMCIGEILGKNEFTTRGNQKVSHK